MSTVIPSKAPVDNTPKVEKPGTVLSDSLAGESAKSGGDFAANTNPSVLNQTAQSSTTNTTDTSGATVLDAAPDAEARQATEGWSESASLDAGKNLGNSGGKPYNTSTGSGANVGDAPTYTASNTLQGEGNPAGKNLKEGGFDSDGPNASFKTDIGGKNDPGRVALDGFQKSNAEAIIDAGSSHDGTSGNSFDALGGSTNA